MRIVILGCGYLGYNLYQNLSKQFETVICGLPSPYASNIDNYEIVDAFDENQLQQLPLEGSIVIDTMSLVSNQACSLDEDTVIQDVCSKYTKLLSSLKKHHVKGFIFLSSGGTVYGENQKPSNELSILHPETLYAKSKVALEKIIQEDEINYLILRLANPYGGYQLMNKSQGVIPVLIKKAYCHEVFELWASKSCVRDYIYIDDFSKAVSELINADCFKEIVNVGSGNGTSLEDVIALVEEATNEKILIQQKDSCVKQVSNSVLDITKLIKLTGFQPKVSMKSGIKQECERIRRELSI